MKHVNIVLCALLVALFGLPAVALPPVFVAGIDTSVTHTTDADGVSLTSTSRPKLSVSLQDRLAGGGYYRLTGAVSIDIPHAEPQGVDDREYLRAEIVRPAGTNEVRVAGDIQTSFFSDGTLSREIGTTANADYRFLDGEGWIAVVSEAFYRRFETTRGDDALGAHLGVELVRDGSIRFAVETALLAGAEVWPEYEMVDEAGENTDATRHDFTGTLRSELTGLWGYFTTWTLGTDISARISNATGYVEAVAEAEADPESRIDAELFSQVATSPTRRLGLSASAGIRSSLYTGRYARREDGSSTAVPLNATSVGLSFDADYNLVENLYLVSTVSASATYSSEIFPDATQLRGEVGLEYSF